MCALFLQSPRIERRYVTARVSHGFRYSRTRRNIRTDFYVANFPRFINNSAALKIALETLFRPVEKQTQTIITATTETADKQYVCCFCRRTTRNGPQVPGEILCLFCFVALTLLIIFTNVYLLFGQILIA